MSWKMTGRLCASGRGIVFSGDLIVAAALYIAVLCLVFAGWGLGKTRLEEERVVDGLQARADNCLQNLVSTSGRPSDWERGQADNITSLGLVFADRVLDEDKVEVLKGMDVGVVGGFLGFGDGDFLLSLYDGDMVFELGQCCGGGFAAESERVVAYRGKTAILRLRLCGDGVSGVFF